MENHPSREVICPKCTGKIVRKSQDGMFRLSTKVLKTSEDGSHVIAVCKSCSHEHTLPCSLQWGPPPIEQSLAVMAVLRKSNTANPTFRFQYQPERKKQEPSAPEVVVRPSAKKQQEPES